MGIVLTVYCYYPGYMSSDSIDQFAQGRTGIFNEHHPPVMSFLLGRFDRLIPGPAGMLIFHNVLFWSGLAMLASTLFGHSYAAWFLTWGIGFSPPVTALLSTIWKDVGMGSALVLSTAFFVAAKKAVPTTGMRAKLYWTLAVAGAFYAVTMRHNALPAVLPLLVFGAFAFLSANLKCLLRIKLVTSLIMGLCITAGMIFVSGRINLILTNGRRVHLIQEILLHDLVVLSVQTNSVLFSDYRNSSNPPLTTDYLRQLYYPISTAPMFWGDRNVKRLPYDIDDRHLKPLMKDWWCAVRAHPRMYLEHRWIVFRAFLGSSVDFQPFFSGIDPNPFGLAVHRSSLNRRVMRSLSMLQNTFLFKTWLYLFIAPIVLIVAIVQDKNVAVVAALATSAVLNLLQYFFVAVSPEFRYSWWSACAVILMLCFVSNGFIRRKTSGSHTRAVL